MLIFLHYKINL